MIRTVCDAVLCFLLMAVTAFAQQRSVSLTSVDLEAFADSFFSRYLREYPDPSLAVVVVKANSIVLMKGYGTEDGQRRVDPSATVFNVASLSKLVVAAAAMQLVDEGAVAIDDDIAPLLGDVRIRGDGPPVTLRHLLTHTSGLEGPVLRDVVADPGQLIPLRQYFTKHPPRRGVPPGEECRYSNYAMALAGYLVEQVSGEPFENYAERHIFTPLGMTSSSFRQPPPDRLVPRVATAGAGRVPDALLLYPAGAMVSSPADMARFLMVHLDSGRVGPNRILSEATVRAMQARQWSADQRVPGAALGFFESTLGGEPGLFHTGARTHFSLLYLFPRQGVGIFVVHSMQQGGAFQTLRTDFIRAFASRYFPPEPQRESSEAGGAARATDVTGVYRPHILPTTTIERAAGLFSDTHVRAHPDGELEVRIPGGPTLLLAPIGPELYRVSAGPWEGLTVAFVRNQHGRVRRMSMSGNTQEPFVFERLIWYQRGVLHAGLLALILLLFVGCSATEFAGGVVRLIRRRTCSFGAPSARLTWAAATVPGLFFVASPLSIAVLVLACGGQDGAADALRMGLIVGCTFLLAGVLAALALIPLSVRVCRLRYWSRPRRLVFYALASGAVVAAPLLLHYHLLGYWF